MKLLLSIVTVVFSGMLLSSCGGSSSPEAKGEAKDSSAEKAAAPAPVDLSTIKMVDFDLKEYGIPAIVKAPEGSKIVAGSSSKTARIDGGNGFLIEVQYKTIFTADDELSGSKQLVVDKTMAPDFEKLEVDEKNGYVCVHTGGLKSFLWVADVKPEGCVSIKNDMYATMAAYSGQIRSGAAITDKMYAAAKETQITKVAK